MHISVRVVSNVQTCGISVVSFYIGVSQWLGQKPRRVVVCLSFPPLSLRYPHSSKALAQLLLALLLLILLLAHYIQTYVHMYVCTIYRIPSSFWHSYLLAQWSLQNWHFHTRIFIHFPLPVIEIRRRWLIADWVGVDVGVYLRTFGYLQGISSWCVCVCVGWEEVYTQCSPVPIKRKRNPTLHFRLC